MGGVARFWKRDIHKIYIVHSMAIWYNEILLAFYRQRVQASSWMLGRSDMVKCIKCMPGIHVCFEQKVSQQPPELLYPWWSKTFPRKPVGYSLIMYDPSWPIHFHGILSWDTDGYWWLWWLLMAAQMALNAFVAPPRCIGGSPAMQAPVPVTLRTFNEPVKACSCGAVMLRGRQV